MRQMFLLRFIFALVATFISSSLSHSCDHDSTSDYLPIIEEPTYDYSDDSTTSTKYRMLFTEIDLPIRITGDYTRLSSLSASQITTIQSIVAVVNQFYYDTITIKRRQGNLYFPYTDEQLVCQEITVNSADTTTGISSSDLHIYFTYENNSTSTTVANARTCVVQSKNQRPIFARFRVNIAQLSVSSDRDFNKYIDIFMHEYMHILGFSSSLYKYWKDSSGNTYDSTMFTTGYFFSELHQVIRTPYLLSTVRSHFDCDYIQGVPLENEGTSESIGSHFEQLALHNDLMVSYRSNSKQIYSSFDDALLKDTGWYSTNSAKIQPTVWGKAQGCDFLEEACSSSKNFNEYCSTSLQVSCDAYSQGKSSCLQEIPYSGICKIYQVTTDCADPASNNSSSYSSEVNALNSRCFVSSLIQSAQPAKSQDAACFQSTCDSTNTQVSIQVGSQTSVCTSNSQILTVVGYSGTLICPTDITSFCQIKVNNCSSCSMSGYCNNGTCSCVTGFIGTSCECRISDLYRYVSGVFQSGYSSYCTALINASYCLSFSGLNCVLCISGYYIQSSSYCLACPLGCSTCTSSSVCTICSTNYFLDPSSQCVQTCASGYFGNVLTGVCEVCSSAPIYCDQCTGLNLCTSCKTTYSSTYVYTERTSASIYVTCSLGACNSITKYADSINECHACDSACAATGCYGPDSTDCISTLTACTGTQIRQADLTCVTKSIGCTYPVTASTHISCCPTQQFQVSSTQCSNCPNNFTNQQVYAQEGECVSSCSDNYFAVTPADFSTKAVIYCQKCDASCDSCTSTLSASCITCADGYYYYRSYCITSCPVETYTSNITKTCIECSTACSGCTAGTDTDCIACAIGYELVYGRCTSVCGYGKYLTFMNECASCITNCAECSLSTVCTKCSVGYYWDSAHSTCVSSCDSGFYADTTTGDCVQCDTSCNTCDATGCLTCSGSLIFSYGTCVSACASNQVSETITNSSGVSQIVCRYCHLSCATCTAGNSKYACTTCNSFYFQLNTSPMQCVQYCPNPTYLVNVQTTPTALYTCQTCPCKTCNSSGECLKCDTGLYLYNNSCVTTCPSIGYFADDANGTCTSCNIACLSCKDDSDTGCKVCNTGYVLVFSGKCIASVTCADTYFFNELQCEPCISNCSICYSSYTCSKCITGYSYNSSTQTCSADVIPSCASGYYYDSGLPKSCVKCADKCHTCSNATSCNIYRAVCHYTCSDCVGSAHTSCTACGSSRELMSYYSDASIGQCRCTSQKSDFGEAICKDSVAEKAQQVASIIVQVLHSASIIGLSLITYNPTFFLIGAEHCQFVGSFSYFRKHNQVGFDDSLLPKRVLNINYLLKAPFGYSQNGENLYGKRMLAIYSSSTQRSREPSKIEEIHSRQSFLASAFAIIILHIIISLIAVFSRRSATYSDSLNDAVNITTKTQRSRRLHAFIQLALPSWVFAITVRELAICIFMQFMDFQTSADSDGLRIIGLILSIICFFYMIVAVFYETIRFPNDSSSSLRINVYFQLINRGVSVFADRYFGICSIKKLTQALFFVFCESSAMAAGIMIFLIEVAFLVGVIIFRPFKQLELNVLTIISEILMVILMFIMLILIGADDTSTLQNTCVFAIIAISNACLMMYACYAVIMMCKKSRENQMYNQIFPEELVSSSNQAADLSMVEADFVKSHLAKPGKSGISSLQQPQPNAALKGNLYQNQDHILMEYDNNKKTLSSIHRSKLVGYAGHKKEVENNLDQQQRALLELQSKSVQRNDQNYPERDGINSKGLPLYTPTTPATNVKSSLLQPPTHLTTPYGNQSSLQKPSSAFTPQSTTSQIPPSQNNYQIESQLKPKSQDKQKKFFQRTLQSNQDKIE